MSTVTAPMAQLPSALTSQDASERVYALWAVADDTLGLDDETNAVIGRLFFSGDYERAQSLLTPFFRLPKLIEAMCSLRHRSLHPSGECYV